MEPDNQFERACREIRSTPRTWLLTGCAGFIGSGILEFLLRHSQRVTGLDNFSTGSEANIRDALARSGAEKSDLFTFIQGDLRNEEDCRKACLGADVILHQAALGSVPRSLKNPEATHASNVTGTLNLLIAAKDAGIRRFVFASSSSVYGDRPDLPKKEDETGNPLSPYAVSKVACEKYALAFSHCFGIQSIGLRYFNVFGCRQRPDGPYAAVIPRWFSAILNQKPVVIHGDGETSRDFTYLANVIQMNILAALTENQQAWNQVYNTAYGSKTSLNNLISYMAELVDVNLKPDIRYDPFRPGDIRHSLADLSRARSLLGYEPGYDLKAGLRLALPWYRRLAAQSLKEEAS